MLVARGLEGAPLPAVPVTPGWPLSHAAVARRSSQIRRIRAVQLDIDTSALRRLLFGSRASPWSPMVSRVPPPRSIEPAVPCAQRAPHMFRSSVIGLAAVAACCRPAPPRSPRPRRRSADDPHLRWRVEDSPRAVGSVRRRFREEHPARAREAGRRRHARGVGRLRDGRSHRGRLHPRRLVVGRELRRHRERPAPSWSRAPRRPRRSPQPRGTTTSSCGPSPATASRPPAPAAISPSRGI